MALAEAAVVAAGAGQGGAPVLVVLAAGAGRRLGGVAKALLRLGGLSYLERICQTARAGGAGRGVAVVAPPYGEAVAVEARRLGLDVVENRQPERGMASSIELGFAWAMERGAGAALLWPCDHPAVKVETVRALLAALEAETGSGSGSAAAPIVAIIPTVAGRGGHPALIARALFPALAHCAAAPEGARTVLRAAATRRLALADAGCVVDVDEPAAAAALAASLAEAS